MVPLYNLTEYRKNYRKAMGSLWNYYRDELTDDTSDINFSNKNVINSESFKWATSVTGSTYNAGAKIVNAESNEINNPACDANKLKLKFEKIEKKEVEIAFSLKYLSNFWRTLDITLINYLKCL